MRLGLAAVVTFTLLLVACDQAALIKRWTPPEDESRARNYVDSLRHKRFDEVTRDLDPSFSDPTARDALVQMASLFPPEDPKSVKVVGISSASNGTYSITNIRLEYQFPSTWLLADISTKNTPDGFTLIGFRVQPLSDSLEHQNRFTFAGKGITRYGILLFAAFLVGLSLYALVLCLRSERGRARWLWALFVLVGVGRLAVNWTTGEWGLHILAINIPCGMAAHVPYGPWIVSALFPVGAVMYLVRREHTRATAQSPAVSDASHSAEVAE
jgi:hypothetical protein